MESSSYVPRSFEEALKWQAIRRPAIVSLTRCPRTENAVHRLIAEKDFRNSLTESNDPSVDVVVVDSVMSLTNSDHVDDPVETSSPSVDVVDLCDETTPSLPLPVEFECVICNSRFRVLESVKRHLRVHGAVSPGTEARYFQTMQVKCAAVAPRVVNDVISRLNDAADSNGIKVINGGSTPAKRQLSSEKKDNLKIVNLVAEKEFFDPDDSIVILDGEEKSSPPPTNPSSRLSILPQPSSSTFSDAPSSNPPPKTSSLKRNSLEIDADLDDSVVEISPQPSPKRARSSPQNVECETIDDDEDEVEVVGSVPSRVDPSSVASSSSDLTASSRPTAGVRSPPQIPNLFPSQPPPQTSPAQQLLTRMLLQPQAIASLLPNSLQRPGMMAGPVAPEQLALLMRQLMQQSIQQSMQQQNDLAAHLARVLNLQSPQMNQLRQLNPQMASLLMQYLRKPPN